MKVGTYVEMLEPHLVLDGKWSKEMLLSIGRSLNSQRERFPKGINVNAWHYIDENKIFVRTYERGVQGLTKSCGTGSIACLSTLFSEGSHIVSTAGGSLQITFLEDNLRLEGHACIL
jgi:diaminopimelate epimerase